METIIDGAISYEKTESHFACFYIMMNDILFLQLPLLLQRGDYLLVGIHGDAVVNRRRGMNLPLMNLHERVLSVLGCRYVDDVLIDAPYEISRDMIASLHIDEVVRGTQSDDIGMARGDDSRYQYPKEAGIFTIIESPSNFNIESIIQRVNRHQETFQAKYERKMAAEKEFYQEKYMQKT